ncbi:MAG: phosphatidate cytidylyltransferase [Gammaproteobacteria bacterium]|nr:phosphatidate cytidylyltransferase [Gammaproteobacteria bacterium]
MLLHRVLTALVLLPLVFGLILFAPQPFFEAAVVLVMAATAREWGRLAQCGRTVEFGLPVLVALVLAGISIFDSAFWAHSLLLAALALWSLSPLWLWRRWKLPAGAHCVAAMVLLPAAGLALMLLHELGEFGVWLIAVLLMVWATDVGAYFAGRGFGNRKLAPSISPAKTWEGALGGIFLAAAVAAGIAFWQAQGLWLEWSIGGLLVAAASIVGDLIESLLKRQAGIKDSGRMLPGHGGALDRLDSLLLAAPVFLAYGMLAGLFAGQAPA